MTSDKSLLFLIFFLFYFPSAINAGFVAGTLVKTSQGFTPVQELNVGDLAFAFDEKKNVFELRPITDVSSHLVTHVIHIQVNGPASCNQVLTDAYQSFYIPLEKRWCAARDLKIGMILHSCDDYHVVVSGVQEVAVEARVHELSIKEHHNFCVTGDSIVAHNAVIAIPIILWGPGGVAFAGGIFKAACAGVGTAILYKLVSHVTGATLDNGIDVSNPNFFGSIDSFPGNTGGIFGNTDSGYSGSRTIGSISCAGQENDNVPKPQCVRPVYKNWPNEVGDCVQPLPHDLTDLRGGCVKEPDDVSIQSICPGIELNWHGENVDGDAYQGPFEDLDGWQADKGFVYKQGQEPKAPDPNGAQAPGMPGPKNNFIPPKNWNGEKVRSPKGYGWPDIDGDIWVPTGPNGHRGAHWDVQHPNGRYQNVLPQDKKTKNWK